MKSRKEWSRGYELVGEKSGFSADITSGRGVCECLRLKLIFIGHVELEIKVELVWLGRMNLVI